MVLTRCFFEHTKAVNNPRQPRRHQLISIGRKLSLPVFSIKGMDPVALSQAEVAIRSVLELAAPLSALNFARGERVELWHNQPNRLHDRLRYERTTDGWSIVRVAP